MIRKYIIIVLLFIGITFNLLAQKNETNLIHKYTTELGLSSNVVYQVLQDKLGFIWIGTEEGLNKFDGKNFTTFSTKKGRYSLSHNRTQALLLAPDGNIWAGTSDGLNIYNYNLDSIIKIRDNTSPLKLIYNDITFLTMSPDNKITWIGTYGNGVNFFDWKKNNFNSLKLPKINDIAPPTIVMSLLEDDNKRLWIGTQHNGLYRYDLEHDNLEYYQLKEKDLFIRTIYQDSFRRIWIGTSKGCYIYNETTNQLEIVNYPEGLSSTSIGVIKEDHQGKIWIGSELFLMNFSVRSFSMLEKFSFQIITQGESNSKLNCPSINALFADRDNNIWIGTNWGGLNMLQGIPPKFKLFKHEAEVSNSLPNTPVTAICRNLSGDLLIGTSGMGVYKMNVNTNEFQNIKLDKQFSGFIYQALLNDKEGNIWLGAYNNGLIKLNKNGKLASRFISNDLLSNSLPNNDIRCIYETKKNKNIWIGTANGMAMYDIKTKKIEKVVLFKNRWGVRSIVEDKYNTLWVGTYGGGVIRYNPADDKINYKPIIFNPKVVLDLLIDNDSLWIATQGEGVILYSFKSKKGQIFTEEDGLSSNYIESVLRDKEGGIWLGTTKGISKLNTNTKKIQNFNTQDGVQNHEFSGRCVALLGDGQMAFGGAGGLNIFEPLKVEKNDRCPPVIFTKLSIFNQIITPSEDKKNKSALKRNITLADKIELKYNQSIFTVEFIGVNYNATQKIQYSYFLEETDKRWNYIGSQNSVTFRNLEPGEYVLKVKASSPDAVWSDENIASIQIIIHPPFWKTWWAYMLYIIITAAIFYFVWQFLALRLQSRNTLRIERAKREKEEELHQEKLQFFTNISHEFRTPLTLLIGPLEKLQKEEIDEKKKSHIKLMLRNANRLLLMVNQLLDFRKTEKGQMNLKVQYADIVVFINEIILSFKELKMKKNIQFEFIHDTKTMMTWFDPEFIDKSLFNLLSNAFKFTPDFGSITVSTSKKTNERGNNFIEISVIDNGKGINPNDIQNIFQLFYQGKVKSVMQSGSGIGLHLTKNLVELHHGSISVESIQNVKTKFTIILPSEQTAYSDDELSTEISITKRQMKDPLVDGRNAYDESITFDSTSFQQKNKKRILLVEDNPEIRSYIIDTLGNDYQIEEAENGKIGLSLANEKEYNLIISDLMMPEMDGIEMCKLLKSSQETDYIPIIMLTAKSSIESRIEGLNVGADSYISKPFHPEHLTVRVSKLIEQRETLKERFSRKISLGNLDNLEHVSDSPDEMFLQKTISIILEKMNDSDFNGDALASELSISRMGLHRKIKAFTDQSTGEFIRNIRLKKACELLVIPGKNVSEVCYEVGFNTPSYFTTCFTETFKLTPSEYARNIKK